MLDVGCGSGILAICASKLGAKKCYAYDIDPVAVKVARENVKDNGCSNIDCEVSDLLKGVENIKFNVDPFTGNLVLFNGDVLTEGANFIIDRYGGNLIFDTPEELETNIFILNTSTGTLYIDT